MWRVFGWALGWLTREIVVKFVVFVSLYAVLGLVLPYAVNYVSGFLNTNALTSAFSAIPAGVWYFVDFFRLDYGLPLCIAAVVCRFLIRRLPVIG